MADPPNNKEEEVSGSGNLSRSRVDVHVGGRIQLRRAVLGMSQTALADLLGVSFQQVQKYESGMNRVSASRLYDISRALRIPISFFFGDMNEGIEEKRVNIGIQSDAYRSDRIPEGLSSDDLYSLESRKLIVAYYRIENVEVRKRILELIQSLSPDGT